MKRKRNLSTFALVSLSTGYHIPVLLDKTIEGLNIDPDGIMWMARLGRWPAIFLQS